MKNNRNIKERGLQFHNFPQCTVKITLLCAYWKLNWFKSRSKYVHIKLSKQRERKIDTPFFPEIKKRDKLKGTKVNKVEKQKLPPYQHCCKQLLSTSIPSFLSLFNSFSCYLWSTVRHSDYRQVFRFFPFLQPCIPLLSFRQNRHIFN